MLGETIGIKIVAKLPSKKDTIVVPLRPTMSYKKPMTSTVGMPMIVAYVKLFAAISEASSGSLSK